MSGKPPLILCLQFDGDDLSDLQMDTEDLLALKFAEASKRFIHCGRFPEIKPGHRYEFRFEFTERRLPLSRKDHP